jgi:hypothetical protein
MVCRHRFDHANNNTTINLLDVSCLTSSGKYNMHTQDDNELNNINQSGNTLKDQLINQ